MAKNTPESRYRLEQRIVRLRRELYHVRCERERLRTFFLAVFDAVTENASTGSGISKIWLLQQTRYVIHARAEDALRTEDRPEYKDR